MSSVGIIGSGSWGTALARVLLKNGHEVIIRGIEPDVVAELRDAHRNSKYLQGVELPERLQATEDLAQAALDKDLLVLAVPSHIMRSVLRELAELLGDRPVSLMSVAKGIENDTLMRMEEVAQDVLGDRPYAYTCLSGPSHAEEVARDIPTAVVAASRNKAASEMVQQLFMGPAFRVYSHSDVAGVELGGALKNIIALAAGICDGVGFGDNTKAALMTRGLVEITRLGVALGAERMTFAGLSGMGDLIVTCMSRHSRNRYVGEQIGRGRTLDEVLHDMVMVAEGVRTTKSAYALAQRLGIEMPIAEKVYEVLFEKEAALNAVTALMTREAKAERWG